MLNSLFVSITISMAMMSTGAPGQSPSFGDRTRAAMETVNWHAFGSAAFAQARKRNRPLLINVGAAWCRYCRVMERESYSKAVTARFINENFVPIKVDYDRQPEVVHMLERAQALANLPAGIPLIMAVTPTGKVFAGGTYFPAKKTGDKPSFLKMLQLAVHEFRTEPSRLEREGIELTTGDTQ